MMRAALVTLVAAGFLVACTRDDATNRRSEDSAPRNADVPAAVGQPEASANAEQWFRRRESRKDWAGYGPPASEASFFARCEDGRLFFNTGEVPPGGVGPTEMKIAFGDITQTVPATVDVDGLPNTDAAIPADADWIDDLALASGQLTITVRGADPLIVPIGEPLTSLVRDCIRAR